MAYVFENQIVGKATALDEQYNEITLNGINGQETDADIIMGGISYLFDIAGWETTSAKRTIDQRIVETE